MAAVAAAPDYVSGFCQNGAHERCPGVFDDRRAIRCADPCHLQVARCWLCGSSDSVDPATLQCTDVEACAATTEARHLSNPVHLQLVAVVQEAADKRASDRDRKRAEQERGTLVDESTRTGVKQERRARKSKLERKPQHCHCGCGGTTKGGMFLAGHDAKLKGVLARAASRIHQHTVDEDWDGVDLALAELIARGWDRGRYANRMKEAKQIIELAGGREAYVAQQVARRCGNG